MAILHLLRHAKSDWGHAGLADHDRPLAPRGERAATLVGAYLQQEGICPDLVLCSSALRTRQTLARVLTFLPETTEVSIEPRMYGASAMQLLRLASLAGDGVDELLMIGHNPGTEYLASHLSISGPAPHLQAMRRKFPTAALASIRLPGCLSSLTEDGGELLRFVTPKTLV